MPRRITGIAIAVALQLVALVLAHDLVFLARYGSRFNEALVHSGHGASWTSAVWTVLAIAALLLIAGSLRLAYLGALVRRTNGATQRLDRRSRGSVELGTLLRMWLGTGTRIALVGVVLLTIQENLERSSIGGSALGAGILLSPEYPWALPITIAVGLLVGFVAALFEWQRRSLVERLRAARAAAPRRHPAITPRPRTVAARLTTSLLGRRSGLRAPPAPRVA